MIYLTMAIIFIPGKDAITIASDLEKKKQAL